MIDFNNTEIAFKSRSDLALRKAYLMFKTISSNNLVAIGNGLANLALKWHLPINWAIKPTIYSHFVGGVNIDDCQKVVDQLSKFNVKSILDYSVEGSEDPEDMQAALEETLQSIENGKDNDNIPFAVFKPTAFCKSTVMEKVSEQKKLTAEEQQEADNFRKRIDRLCKAAHDIDKPILIDAEDTFYQHFIDEVVTEMMEKYNTHKAIVYNTLQMYRWDRLDFLKQQYQRANEKNYFIGMKFVRGAYMEKERERAARKGYVDPIQPNKEATDRDYNEGLKFSVENIERIAIFNGTHNEYSARYLTELMTKHNLAKDDPRIWTAQLYGMSDHISFNLASAGYNVAKYVPYGPVRHVLPYLLRRVEENTSVAGQTGRELGLIVLEMKRRQQKS